MYVNPTRALPSLLLVTLLAGCQSNPPDLFQAARDGDVKAIRRAADSGAGLDARKDEVLPAIGGKDKLLKRATPLLCAVANGRSEACQELLKRGANVNLAAENGVSPLICASYRDSLPLAKLLLEAGGDVNAADDGGNTALHFGVMDQNPDLTSFLLRQGAKVDSRNKSGWTPLCIAAFGKDMTAKVNRFFATTSATDERALWEASSAEWDPTSSAVVRTLLAAGANPLTRDQADISAMGIAIYFAPSTILHEMAAHVKTKDSQYAQVLIGKAQRIGRKDVAEEIARRLAE